MSQSEETIRRRIDALGLDRAIRCALRPGRQRNYRRAAGRGRSEPRQVRDSGRRTTRAAAESRIPIPILPRRRPWPRTAACCRRTPRLVPSKDDRRLRARQLCTCWIALPIITGATCAAPRRCRAPTIPAPTKCRSRFLPKRRAASVPSPSRTSAVQWPSCWTTRSSPPR